MQLHQLLVALVAACLAVCDAQQQPRFEVTGSSTIIQSSRENWEAGQPSSLAFVTDESGSKLRVQLTGGKCTNEIQTLMYKCPGSTEFSETSLSSLTTSVNLCATGAATLPTILRKYGDVFTIRALAGATAGTSYRDTFTKKLEIKVKVECTEVTLLSNSLFVTSLGAMEHVNAEVISRDFIPGTGIQRRFLTENGLRFLAQMELGSDEFGSVDLIDMSVINVINSAPDLIKSKIGIGAFINIDADGCYSPTATSAITFTTYNKIMTANGLMKTIFLNKEDGRLHYSTYGLSKVVSEMLPPGVSKGIALCVEISINGRGITRSEVLQVAPTYTKPSDKFPQQGSRNSNCKVIDVNVPKSMELFSGSDEKIVTCPIVCSDANANFRFEHNRVSLSPAGSDWKEYPGVQVHPTGKFLKFSKDVSQSNAGDYTCYGGSASFTFTVTVVSMPHFPNPLPQKIFAMEGGNYNFTCSASFARVESVTVAPQFRTNQVDLTNPQWTVLSKDDFNRMVRPGGSEAVAVTSTSDMDKKSLTVSVSSVPAAVTYVKKNFTHRFVCDASVGARDLEKLGMPSYSVQISTDVFFVARPKMQHFVMDTPDCFAEGRCKAEKGERFSVSLKPELSSYLNRIGVEVDGEFRVGSSRLQEVLAGFVGPADSAQCNITFNSTGNSLVFTVRQINDLELVKKLSGLNVTPVFNFRYRKDWDVANLKFSVDSEKSLLLADRKCNVGQRCFYSTDFDVATDLSDLQFSVDFSRGGANPLSSGGCLSSRLLLLLCSLVAVAVAE